MCMPLIPNSAALRAALLLCMAMAPFAGAQLIQVAGGDSTLVPSQGGAINFQGKNYDGYLGAGDINGSFRMGALLNTTFDSYKLTMGDDPIRLQLPTDIFDSSHYFIARGVGVGTRKRGVQIFSFIGKTAFAIGGPLFQAAVPEQPVGVLYLDVPVSDTLHFTSRNLFSERQTSIQGVDWNPRKWLKTGLSAGIGSNQPYLAASFDANRPRISVQAAYISAGDRFRRITVNSPLNSEVDKENILVTVRPTQNLELEAGRQNYLQPQQNLSLPFLHAAVNQVQGSYGINQLRFGGGLFQSNSQGRDNLGETLWASRPITHSIDAGINYFRSSTQGAPVNSTVSLNLREVISPKLSLLELVNHSTPGTTNVLFGGSYISNRFTIGVDYTTLYFPFLSNPFQQSIGVTLGLKLFGSAQINTQSFVGTDGKVRYTASGSTAFVRGFHLFGGTPEVYKFPKYIINGRVIDQAGSPIEGIAVRIDQVVVTTNSAGEFLARKKKQGLYTVELVWEEFTNPVAFDLVSAPRTAMAAPEGAAPEALIVLRRTPMPPKHW